MEYDTKQFIPDTRRIKKSCNTRHRFASYRHLANGSLLIVARKLGVEKRCIYGKRNRPVAHAYLPSAYLKAHQALVGLMHS
jgi:hypothetical protein